VELAQIIKEIFGSPQWREQISQNLPLVFKNIAGYIGYSFASHMASHPEQVAEVFGTLKNHNELEAAMEQYLWMYGWGGDRSAALKKCWQVMASKHFGVNSRIEAIHRDENQQKLIGMASGLESYCDQRSALTALLDGISGGLESYMARAAQNEELDYKKGLQSSGNKVLTEARHVADFCSEDSRDGEDKCQTDDEILSRLGIKFQVQGDSLAEKLEVDDILDAWWQSITQQQQDIVKLMNNGDNQCEIACKLGLSQQRVSQILSQVKRKLVEFKKSQVTA